MKSLRNGIISILSDRVHEISVSEIRVFGGGDWDSILKSLEEWQSLGYLNIVRDPRSVADDEICVEMKTWFEFNSPTPGFLNSSET